MPPHVPVRRASLTLAATGLLLVGCHGHGPRQPAGPGGPPAATPLAAFDPAGVGVGPPPAPAPARPLDVVDYGPIGRTEGGGQIHVRFNQPVVPLDLPPAEDLGRLFAFDPPLPGRARWLAPDHLVFDPDEPLRDCQGYTARFLGGLTGPGGQRFDRVVTWSFETVRPTVDAAHPEPGAVDRRRDSAVLIRFDRDVDLAEVQRHVTAGARPISAVEADPTALRPVAVRVRRATRKEIEAAFYYYPADDPRPPIFAVQAQGLWPLGSEVEVAVTPGLRSKAGPLPLDTPWSTRFKTYRPQAIERMSCAPGDECGLEPITLTLRNPVRERELRKISISPRPKDLRIEGWDAWDDGAREVSISGMFVPGTTYTVRVPGDLRDIFAQTLPAAERRAAVIAPRPTLALSTGAGILIAGRRQTVGLESRHVKAVRVRVGVFSERELEAVDLAPARAEHLSFPVQSFERTFTLTPTGKGDWSSLALDLADLTKQARGAALLEVAAAELVPAAASFDPPVPVRALLRLTDLGPVAVASSPSSSVQVLRLSTGAPVPGARVARLGEGGELTPLGATDAGGRLALPAGLVPLRDASRDDPFRPPRLVVTDAATADRAYLDLAAPYVYGPRRDDKQPPALRPGERLIARVVSERGVYRPGEKVRVVGWSALDTPFARSNLARPKTGSPVKFELRDRDDRVVAAHATRTTAEGKFWAELPVPAGAALGRYEVRAELLGEKLSASVKVEDYRVPEFTVEASARRPDILAGESTPIDVRASYYFGGPVQVERLTSHVACEPRRYRPPGLEDMWEVGEPYQGAAWGRSRPSVVHPRPSPDTPGRGSFTTTGDVVDATYPHRCTASVEVQDAAMQGIGAEAGFAFHPARFYLALAAPRGWHEAGEKGLRLQVRAVDVAGARVAARDVALAVTRRWWAPATRAEGGAQVHDGRVERTEKVKTCALDVAAAGPDAACELPPLEQGAYELRVTAKDDAGREARTRDEFRVWPRDRRARVDWRGGPPPAHLEIKLSQDQVRPGDTLEVAVRGPWPGAAGTLVLARGGVRDARPFALGADHEALLRFPVDDTWTPEVALGATVVVPPASASALPRLQTASARVVQDFEHRRLRVHVDAPAKAGPGDEIPVTVRVRDDQDRPAAARVALWAVDEAVLDLTRYEVPDLLPGFIARRGPEYAQSDDYSDLLHPYWPQPEDPWFVPGNFGLRGVGAGGGGSGHGYGSGSGGSLGGRGAHGPPPARSRFETTPLFLADLAVDRSGEARVTAAMPENLTTFRITAVASARLVDGESPGRFGKGDARTTVTAPLVVRAALPRQLRPGDGGELAAIVQNNTGAAGRVEVTAKVVERPGSQGQVLKLMSSGTASAELPDGGQVRLPFRVQAQVPGAPEFELQAAFTPAGGGAPVHDGVRVPLPVEAERTLTERVAAYGTVTDDTPVAIPVKIPRDVLPGYGGVTIATSSSLLGGLEDAVHALVTYPYGCVEQTSSRLLPLIALGDLLKTYPLGIDDPRAFVAAGVERLLAMQTREGGFAYWPGGDEVHVYASAYATWVLHLAAKAGYPVPEDALARAIADLERRVAGTSFANVAVDWGYDAGVRLAIALHVLADAGRDVAGPAAALYARRQSLPLFGRAFLLMAMHRGSPRAPEVAALAGELRGNLRELPATAHTSEAPRWDLGGYFSSDGRSDAIVLMALLRAEPDHPVVVKLARGLLERRIGGAWRNTQENAYALVALTDYARAYESETPDFTARAWVGPQNVLDVAFSGREFATRAATTDMVRLVGLSQGTGATDPLPVVLQRQGTGRLYYRLGAEWAPAAADLPARAQGLTVARALRTRAGPARDAVTAGEPAALDITVTSDTRVRYVVVDVPLPAGLEAVSRTLGSGRRAAVLSGHRGWWVTHEEQRPGRVVVFADDLPPGTHVHTIDLRATTRGSYAFPPTHAEAMYMPEVYGRTIGGALEVR